MEKFKVQDKHVDACVECFRTRVQLPAPPPMFLFKFNNLSFLSATQKCSACVAERPVFFLSDSSPRLYEKLFQFARLNCFFNLFSCFFFRMAGQASYYIKGPSVRVFILQPRKRACFPQPDMTAVALISTRSAGRTSAVTPTAVQAG